MSDRRPCTEETPKHTPGPWFGKHGHRTTIVRGVYTRDGYCVVTFGGIAKPASAEGQANARLISAAPDLLHALDCILWRHMDDEFIPTEYWDMAKEAIAKAKGLVA